MKRFAALMTIFALLPLSGCVVAPIGPPRYYEPRAVVVAPVVVRPYGYYHEYRRW